MVMNEAVGAAARTEEPPRLVELLGAARDLIEGANRAYQAKRLPCGSRALAFAVEAGFKPQMAYTVDQTVLYTGISRKTLYAEHSAGRLKFISPAPNSKGSRIAVDEMDRWMEANER